MNAPATTFPPETTRALATIPWLKDVTSEALARLSAQAILLRLPRGAQIFDQAETPAFAQVLLTGVIELAAVRGEEETLVELVRPLDLLLPAAVLSRQPYLVRGRVRDEASLLLIPAETFRQTVAEDHAFCLAVLACQAAQFRRQMKLAKAIRLRSAEERVGSFLLALAETDPARREHRLPLEKRQIASQLGMTRETLSRALPPLARAGLRVEGDTLFVDDLAAARGAFPFDPLIDGADVISPLAQTRTS